MKRDAKGRFKKSRATVKSKATKTAKSRAYKSVKKSIFFKLRNTSGNHNKEYIVKQSGQSVTTKWGPIGGWQKSQVKLFKTAREAAAWAVKQARSKVSAGYKAVR